jgi:hypothetical protein
MNFLQMLMALSLTFALSTAAVADPHNHHETGYVPWGTDEFELFDLTQPELKKEFKDKLEFDEKLTHAWFNHDRSGPQFLLTFSNGKVSKIERLFIDGGGCNILGPTLTSKREALQFSIDGLRKLNSSVPQFKEKLAQAQKSLSAMSVLRR